VRCQSEPWNEDLEVKKLMFLFTIPLGVDGIINLLRFAAKKKFLFVLNGVNYKFMFAADEVHISYLF
jgi:hypothetical protein